MACEQQQMVFRFLQPLLFMQAGCCVIASERYVHAGCCTSVLLACCELIPEPPSLGVVLVGYPCRHPQTAGTIGLSRQLDTQVEPKRHGEGGLSRSLHAHCYRIELFLPFHHFLIDGSSSPSSTTRQRCSARAAAHLTTCILICRR